MEVEAQNRLPALYLDLKQPREALETVDRPRGKMLARQIALNEKSLAALTSLFPVAKSLDVQRATAGILIRADYASLAKPDFVRALQTHRRKSSDGQDLIDILIRRLQASLAPAA